MQWVAVWRWGWESKTVCHKVVAWKSVQTLEGVGAEEPCLRGMGLWRGRGRASCSVISARKDLRGCGGWGMPTLRHTAMRHVHNNDTRAAVQWGAQPWRRVSRSATGADLPNQHATSHRTHRHTITRPQDPRLTSTRESQESKARYICIHREQYTRQGTGSETLHSG